MAHSESPDREEEIVRVEWNVRPEERERIGRRLDAAGLLPDVGPESPTTPPSPPIEQPETSPGTTAPRLAAHDSSGRVYPLAIVEWHDSCTHMGWHRSLPCLNPSYCRSVGWLIHEGPETIVIAGHIADEDDGTMQHGGEMTIPRLAITKIDRLS